MKLLLLHLSDIHIVAQRNDNPILNRTKEIASAVCSISPRCNACISIVSGDIAFSGKTDEYSLAKEFFDQLEKDISHRIKDCSYYLFLVPGNHDCDFSISDSIRDMVVTHYSTRTFDEKMLGTCLQVQKNFDEFAKNEKVGETQNGDVKSILKVKSIEIGNKVIEIRLLNSALLSTKNEKQGALFFPTDLINLSTNQSIAPDIIISVLHHPYNWFESINARSLRENLESTSDIILTGHEHEGDYYKKSRINSEEVEYIEGSVLQDNQNQNQSQFNALVFDLDTQTQRLHQFSWSKLDRYDVVSSSPIPLLRNSYRLKNQFTLK